MESADEFIAGKSRKWERERDRTTIRTKDVGRRGTHAWAREAWTFHVQSNYPRKVLVIERLRNAGFTGKAASPGARRGDIEYRFGYFILGQIGRAKGRWVWGQFAPFIPHTDLMILLQKARAEGTFL